MPPNFSVVLIARNEAKTLPRLVESLAEFQRRGGEIVLVDTGSTDGTPELARSLGCKVERVGERFLRTITSAQAKRINREFVAGGEDPIVKPGDRLFDYSAARNFAATLASKDMIATPDCDEIYTVFDIDRINEAIARGVEQLEYNFVFAHDPDGKPSIQFLHSKFYDRRKASWTKIIHEVLVGEVTRERFPEDVIKLEHWQNPETNRGGYLKGLALGCLEDPNDDRNAHYLGRELLYCGRPKSAIQQLRHHVAMRRWPEERSESLVLIGDAMMCLGDVPSAIHSWVDAFDTCPARREPVMRIAEYYRRAGSPQHTVAYAAAALTIPPGNFYAAFQPYYEHLPHELLAWAYMRLGSVGRAVANRLMCPLPTISVVVPTLRPAGMERLGESLLRSSYPQERLELIAIEDSPRLGVPRRVAEGVARATGDWICYAADDMEFEPDAIATALLDAEVSGKRFVAFNSGPVLPDRGNVCEHFMIRRDLLAEIGGEVFDLEFHHVGVDNLLWVKMEKAGEAFRSEGARVIHHHFSKGAPMDDVHRLAWDPEKVAEDRARLGRKLATINGAGSQNLPGNN